MKTWNDKLILNAYKFDFPVDKPYFELSNTQKEVLWKGNVFFKKRNNHFFKTLEEQTFKIQYRVMLSRFRGKTQCPDVFGDSTKSRCELY